jgi:hypothetical protein
MRRESVSANFTSTESGRWNWSVAAELSHRDFRAVVHGDALTPSLLSKGYGLRQSGQVNVELLCISERRLTVSGSAGYDLGRLWSTPGQAYIKLQPALHFHWFPQSRGDDYEMIHQVRAGKTFGDLPFDELSMLGVERDNDLWLRGHIGTRDGRKGSSPLGRNYFLSNWEVDKNVFSNGVLTIKIGAVPGYWKDHRLGARAGISQMAVGHGHSNQVPGFWGHDGFFLRQGPEVGEQRFIRLHAEMSVYKSACWI